MEYKTGLISDKFIQVKMLILFVMSRLSQPISMELLTELTLCDERISYFDVTECIAKLVSSEHIEQTNDKYTLTPKGIRNGEILSEDLPYSVRKKAEEAAANINAIIVRDALITARSSANENGGWNISLSLSDGVSDIISLQLLAANEEQAALLEKGFRKKTQTIYHEIINLLTN